MSYDIDFRVKVEGIDKYVSVGECTANITYNVRKIIELSTGLPWLNEQSNGLCVDVIPAIEKGASELLAHGEKYKQYEAPNGWGTVDGTLRFFHHILAEWRAFKQSEPELAKIAVFWIY